MMPYIWISFGTGGATLALLILATIVGWWLMRRLLAAAQSRVAGWRSLSDQQPVVLKLFAGLRKAIVYGAWLAAILVALRWFSAPAPLISAFALVLRIYLVLAAGLAFIWSSPVLVGVLDDYARDYTTRRGWQRQYDHLRKILPTLRACLDYALWVGVVSLALFQIARFRGVAAWGPLVIEAIAIFLVGRLAIELGHLEIAHRMLPAHGLEEGDRRRRATMMPLVRTSFTYVASFITAVLILGALGFNPLPFLAGAGILGLVVGFGAQPMINDVVSGFFILFENIYLVGDTIEGADAGGVVEAIDFRTTKIRDADGRLHIIRNGDMKQVVNYSKDYAVAVVALDVTYGADLRAVFTSLHRAGEYLRRENGDVLEETRVDGITSFGPSTMTIRTSTRVKPGRHEAVAAALRLHIKETFDAYAGSGVRKTLIPETLVLAGL